MNAVLSHIDWFAVTFGAIGSFLWARGGPNARYSCLWWLSSSLLWIGYAWNAGLPALGMRDGIALGFNLYGTYRYLLPQRAKRLAEEGAGPSTVF